MASNAQESFADQIYEAAIIPELWPQVLRQFSRMAEGQEAALIATSGEKFKWICSSAEADELARRVFTYAAGSERTRRLVARQHAGFVTDRDVFTDEEILSEPMFAEYLIPNGYGRGVATAVSAPSGDTIILHAEGNFRDGPFGASVIQRLDAIRPHLARASLLSARLGIERARAAAQALEVVGLPAAVLGRGGRALAANGLLVAMMPHVILDRPRHLALADRNADVLFRVALEAIEVSADADTVRSIPIPASEAHPPVIIHLVPVRGAAHDIFAASTAILLATPVVPKEVPGANVLQALFDLTPAEARVARAIGNGATADAIATATGASVVTVRNQLNRVLAKSGLHRQSELVGLLRSAGFLSGDPAA